MCHPSPQMEACFRAPLPAVAVRKDADAVGAPGWDAKAAAGRALLQGAIDFSEATPTAGNEYRFNVVGNDRHCLTSARAHRSPRPRRGAAPLQSFFSVPAAGAAMAALSLRLAELPGEVLQTVLDWLPAYQDRIRVCRTCSAASRLEWHTAPPLWLDEELSGFRFGDKGAEAIARALVTHPNNSIGELCLGSNGIGDAGARALAAALGSGKAKLRRLSLRDNDISDAGAQALATALSAESTLEELDLWGNKLTDAGKRSFLSQARCEVFLELSPAPCSYMASTQTLVNVKMRAILFDWISQVLTGINLPLVLGGGPDPQDTLFRTFSHFDLFLSRVAVRRAELQVIGIACALVAAGMQTTVNVEDDMDLSGWLAVVTDGACSVAEVRATVQKVHQALELRLHQPTVYTFLRRYLRRTGWTEESFSLANYLIEVAAIDDRFLVYRPQTIAAAAAVLSRQYLPHGVTVRHALDWKVRLLRCACLDLHEELAPCLAALAQLHASFHGRATAFVNKKYAWARLHMVSKIVPIFPPDEAFFVSCMLAESA